MNYQFNPFTGTFDLVGAAGADSSILAIPAAGDILAHKVVTTSENGKVIYGNADNVSHQGRILGVSINSASADEIVRIATTGLLSNTGWSWIPGDVLYVGLDGNITTEQVGAFSQNLGYARTPTEIFIRLGRSVVRG